MFFADMTRNKQSSTQDVDFAELSHSIAAIERSNPKSDLLSVLNGSLNLKVYRESLMKELAITEDAILQEVTRDSSSILSLYKETQECERILCDMDATLSGFADSLRGVSDEIRQLQDKSEELSIQLKSRSETQEKLISFVDAVIVSPEIVSVICEEEDCSSARFISAIEQLGKKLRLNAPLDPTLPAVAESTAEFQKIKFKAVLRIREYISSKLSQLKQPKTSLKHIQKTSLIKSSPVIRFLRDLDSGVFYMEIASYYFATVSKFYLNFFRTYVQGLSKYSLEPVATKADLLGLVEGMSLDTPVPQLDIVNRLKLGSSTPTSGGAKSGLFSFPGIRERVIKEDVDVDPLSLQSESSSKQYPEALLRSYQKLLAETVTCEYEFLHYFFDLSDSPGDIQRFCDSVFYKSLVWLVEHIGASVRDSYDSLGLMLSIRIVEFFEDQMSNRKKIPCLDSYFETVLALLRGRLKFTLEQHVESLKRIDVKKVTLVVSQPLTVTKRFADFISAILSVRCQLTSEDPHLSNQIESLISVYEALMVSLGKRLSSQQDQQVWHLNNVDVVLSTMRAKELSDDKVPALKKFAEKFNMYVSVFVERKLSDHFGSLIKLTTDLERSGGSGSVTEAERQAVWFQQNWKSELQKIQREIVSENQFSNFSTGNEILKSVMTQLLLYYTRFQKVVGSKFPKHIVPSAVIMAEIKLLQTL